MRKKGERRRYKISGSCPDKFFIPPRPPPQRPSIPSVQPPNLLLPPSPPLFETLGSSGKKEEKSQMSRSLSTYYSSSVPVVNGNYIASSFKSKCSIGSESKSSTSPTIFSMLRTRASVSIERENISGAASAQATRDDMSESLQFNLETMSNGTSEMKMSGVAAFPGLM